MSQQKPAFSTAATARHILVCLLLFLAGDLLSSLALDLLFAVARPPAPWLYQLPRALGALALTWALFRLYAARGLRLGMAEFGVTFSLRGWAVAASVLLPVLVAAAFLPLGEVSVTRGGPGEVLGTLAVSLAFALKAGVTEELLFRGFLMKLVDWRWGKRAAILLPSVLFASAHLFQLGSAGPGEVLLLVLGGSLVGIMFSLVADRSGSVSNSVLMHTLWNLVMVTGILCITTDQGESGAALFSIVIPSGNVLLTGGDFGVEASAVAVLGYGAVCCLALLMRKTER